MQFSERILKVKPSPTLEITALAKSMKAKGIDVIGFGAGEPDFDTPEYIKQAAVKALEDGKTKYTPAGGIPELKEAIVQKFKEENNLKYNNSNITVNCGGKHSFYNLMQILLNEGDEVIVPSPYWVSYPSMVLLAGGEPVFIKTTEESGFKISHVDLEKAITNRTRAIIINSPSNPTGAVYSRKELEDISSVLIKHDIVIITDDIYESILYDDREFSNIANLSEDLKKRTVVLNGVSKSFSMTGWRIGYMAADENIIKKVEILQSQSTSNPTSISQWAALEALKGNRDFVKEMLAAFDKRRKVIFNGLNQIEGISCLKPEGSFYIFPNIKGVFDLEGWSKIEKKYESEHSSSKFSSYLLEEAKVAVVPGIAFGSDYNLRLSYAISDQSIEDGIQRIKKAVENI